MRPHSRCATRGELVERLSSTQAGSTEIGLISCGHGIDPAIVQLDRGRRAILGHGTWVTWMDLEGLRVVSSHDLAGAFYDFLAVGRDDQIVALHELGALLLDAVGGVHSSVDAADIVTSSRIDDENLILTLMDSPPLVVSWQSGRISRRGPGS